MTASGRKTLDRETPVALLQEHQGSCHCGAVGFVYRTALAPEEWPIRACQCTFCRMHSSLSTSDPGGSLTFIEHITGSLHHYQFGRKITDFILCRNCGAYLGAMMQSGKGTYGVINVRILLGLRGRLRDALSVDYDAESMIDRKMRREERWTPVIGG